MVWAIGAPIHPPWGFKSVSKNGKVKGKATRGLATGSLFPQLAHRPLPEYERYAQGGDAGTADPGLHDNLSRLKLTRAAELLDTIIEEANAQKSSYLGFLDHLLEEMVAAKEGRRIQTAMKTAGLSAAKTIEQYDFSFHPHLGAVMKLFDLTFLAKKENVLFLGPHGVGKTHFAISLAIKACHHGFKVYFTTMDTLIKKLKEGATRQKAYLSSSLVELPETELFTAGELLGVKIFPSFKNHDSLGAVCCFLPITISGATSSGWLIFPFRHSPPFPWWHNDIWIGTTTSDHTPK